MYIKSGAIAQKENSQEIPGKKQLLKQKTQSEVSVGDHMKCPECKTIGRVVWVSQDKKTIGVQCPAIHRETIRPKSKYGPTVVPSGKTRKNVVFLTASGE